MVAAAGQYCPVEHSEHVVVDEKEPAAHSEQADALAEAENEPAAQRTGITAVVMMPV